MISILCPTRKRPAELKRLIASILDTTTEPIELCCYLDEDDEDSYQFDPGIAGTVNLRVKFKVGPRLRKMTQCWNDLVPIAQGDLLMLGNDDVVFRTHGWERMVEDAFASCPDKILLVHGDDLAGQNCAHPIVHRRWVDALGYFLPPYFSSDFGDYWLYVLGESLGRRRFLPFVAEHMHFAWGKAEIDETTRERLDRGQADNVSDVWTKLEPERLKDIAKLAAQIQPPKWTIMILTQPSRREYLKRLLSILEPQVRDRTEIQVLIQTFDDALSLGANRERMRREALGEYINFIDDDDVVPNYYVARILPLLDGVDYIGFRVQCFIDGVPFSRTYHSLRYKGWFNDNQAYYRDISHLNPIRRELALQAQMEGGFAEDNRWADAMRSLGIVKTEHRIEALMYLYYSRTVKDDASFRFEGPDHLSEFLDAKEPVGWPAGQMVQKQQGGKPCPSCKSICTVPFSNGTRCNQCGNQFA